MQTDLQGLFKQASELLPNAELMTRLRHTVRDALTEKNIHVPDDASILFDDTKGRVCIIHEVHAWDGEAIDIAQESARVLLSDIVQSTPKKQSSFGTVLSNYKDSRLATFLFWGFNGMVLAYWVGWFLRFVFSENFREWYGTAKASSDFGIFGFTLFLTLPLIPLAVVLYRLKFAHDPLYVVSRSSSFLKFELPALFSAYFVNSFSVMFPLTTGLRIFGILLYITVLYVWFLSVHRISWSKPWAQITHFSLSTISLVFGAYITLVTVVPWYLFFFEEVVVDFFQDAGGFVHDIFLDPMSVVPIFLLLCAVILPPVIVWKVGKSVLRRYTAFFVSVYVHNPRSVRVAVYGSVPVFLLLLGVLSLQPSLGTYGDDLIYIAQEDLSYDSISSRALQLVDEKDTLDTVLRYAVYASEYYLFDESDFGSYSYERTPITSLYLRVVAFPFIYNDEKELSQNQEQILLKGYERVFGYPFGYDPEKTVAPYKSVTLVSRDIHAETKGSDVFAEVTVTDSFTTFLRADQEVVYEFSLPAEAVVTDLRLGSSLEHKGQIAPRGAAQQLYTEEVRRTRDPALLEQVGPRQYRLRVYPVPGASDEAERRRREEVGGEVQRVQFSYIVMRTEEGIPLPQYSETYNVLDNEVQEEIRVNGKEFALAKDGAYIIFPLDVKTICSGGESRTLLDDTAKLTLGGESGVYAPACTTDAGNKLVASVRGKKILLLIDSSFEERDGELAPSLEALRAFPDTFFENNDVEYRFVSDVSSQSKKVKKASEIPRVQDIVFFGHANLQNAFTSSKPGQVDTVLVISGKGTIFKDSVRRNISSANTVRRNTSSVKETATPVYQLASADVVFVLPSEQIPTFPTSIETVLSYAQSFTVTSNVHEALASLVGEGVYTLHGGYWHLEVPQDSDYSGATMDTTKEWHEQTLYRFVEHLAITNEARLARKNQPRTVMVTTSTSTTYITTPGSFDMLYTRAQAAGIVTPLSSYIALVNANQQVRLNELSNKADKYTSEQQFSVTQPNSFANPMSAGSVWDGDFLLGKSSMSLEGDMPMAPSLSMGGSTDVPTLSTTESPVGQKGANVARFLVLLFVAVLFGGILFTAVRTVRRRKM